MENLVVLFQAVGKIVSDDTHNGEEERDDYDGNINMSGDTHIGGSI